MPIPSLQEEVVLLLDSLEVALLELATSSPQAKVTALRLLVRASQLLSAYVHIPEVAAMHQEIQYLIRHAEALQPEDIQEVLQTARKALETVAAQLPALRVHILVVEPDVDSAALLSTMLETPYRSLTLVATAKEAQALLCRQPFHLVITELLLPDLDGRSLLLWIRQQPNLNTVPVLLLSSRASSTIKAECYALGADGFLEKPFDPAMLTSTVANLLQRTLLQQGGDPLTGLPGRVMLEEAFARFCSLHASTGAPFCLALIDLDHFSEINQRYGTAAADEILRQAAWRLGRLLRPGDFLGRWESDMFCLLLPDTSATQAKELLTQALRVLQLEPFEISPNASLVLSFSACIVPVTSPQVQLVLLIEQAQKCLMVQKTSGTIRTYQEPSASKPRILLVEDDPDIAALIQIRLQRDGYEVVVFANGREAAAWAQTNAAQLVILDVKLPGMDGFELLSFLRSQPAYKTVPIVLLTSLSQEHHVVRGFELGADDYVLKPFSPVELSARVRRLLHRQEIRIAQAA
ncbi:response regulator [Rhodothermus bifroesti]|uniref:Response regulator n=1 Tax=Rhodothermus marinus TaxID=29549 RepID=A0A7V2B1G5_RHOMR|nr:response regulator [Rhodothermus bifroesti]GBD01590.1 Alkaline phosphatase synthesis transcriptional regulatory protein PhoP [bacterium HR18]